MLNFKSLFEEQMFFVMKVKMVYVCSREIVAEVSSLQYGFGLVHPVEKTFIYLFFV